MRTIPVRRQSCILHRASCIAYKQVSIRRTGEISYWVITEESSSLTFTRRFLHCTHPLRLFACDRLIELIVILWSTRMNYMA